MDSRKNRLRTIPQVDFLIRQPQLMQAQTHFGSTRVVSAARAYLQHLRKQLLQETDREVPSLKSICKAVLDQLEQLEKPALYRVINATGVALHTNLGRAPLAKSAIKAVVTAAGCCNLEYDVENGRRGSRNDLVEPLLCEICGCEAAMAVNNNAAALLLALSTLSPGRHVPVSRGELVEIGDSFRVPEIMGQSGAVLTEVGTTNKTKLSDYKTVLNTKPTGLLLKVHTSNYRVVGFTQQVSVRDLSVLAKAHNVPLLVDLGSGAVLEKSQYSFMDEPTVPQILADGADLVCFSGDKLLGGPQAGILLGKRELIEQMRKNPLARALRMDKLSLAALEATLRLYRDPEQAKRELPVLQMLCTSKQELREKANTLLLLLKHSDAHAQFSVLAVSRPVGGGAAPCQELDSFAVAVMPQTMSVTELEQHLRGCVVPIIARISEGRLLLDVSTIETCDFSLIVDQIAKIGKESAQ